MDFFILGLPRSRTAWLANFFTTDTTLCLHEPLATCRSLDDLDTRYPEGVRRGAADTAGVLLWRPLAARYPSATFILVHRDRADVERSMCAVGLDTSGLNRLALYLRTATQALVGQGRGIAVDFDRIDAELPTLWRFITDAPFNAARANALRDINIQRDMRRLDITADIASLLGARHG